jgi:hypothetical protein
MACVAAILQSSISDMCYFDYVWDVWFECLLRHHALLLSLYNTLKYLCEWMHACECVGVGHFYCEDTWPTSWWARRPLQMWPMFHLSYLICGCSCVQFCLFCSLLFSFCLVHICSLLFCLVTSCFVLCHAVLTRIALFLCFTFPYSMPFYAMRHCGVCVTLHNAPSIHFCVYFVPKPYLTVVFLYTHWSRTSYIRSTTRHGHGACVSLQFSISRATLLCSLSLHFCHFQVTKWSMSTCLVVDISNIRK